MQLRGDTLLDALGAKARRHGREFECQRRVQEWITGENGHADLISPDEAHAWRFDALASAMYPDLQLETVVVAACFTIWIAVLDDIVEERPDRIAELRDAHISGDARRVTTSTALVRAWLDVRARLSARADTHFEHRIDAGLHRLFDAYAWEARIRESGQLPTLAELETHRHASGGLPLYLLLLERGTGGPFAHELEHAEWFIELNQLAGNLTCFANDILSSKWDRDIDNPINLTRVLSGDSAQRQDRALAYFLDEFARLRALIADARTHAASDPAFGAYLNALPTLVTGVVVWMQETRRYETPARENA